MPSITGVWLPPLSLSPLQVWWILWGGAGLLAFTMFYLGVYCLLLAHER